jgi:hypothetical protein
MNPDVVIEDSAKEIFYLLTQLPGRCSDRQKKLGKELFRFLAVRPFTPSLSCTPSTPPRSSPGRPS